MDCVRPDRSNSKKDNGDRPKPASRHRARKSSHGTSRRSILKNSFAQEQVDFNGSIGDDPVVGIIGGGMSGLVCALELEKRMVQSSTRLGMHGLGGRMGTRMIDPERLVFDHAAQFFTVSDDQFAAMV